MTAFMNDEVFPQIHAPKHRNPEKYRINAGTSVTNPATQTGRQGAEWFNGCHHHSRLPADFHPVIAVATVNAFSPRARVLLTRLHNGAHPILDGFSQSHVANQGNYTNKCNNNKCHKLSCYLATRLVVVKRSWTQENHWSSWVFNDVRWAEISPWHSSEHEHIIGHVCKQCGAKSTRAQMMGALLGRARSDTLYGSERWSFRSS